MGHQLECSIVLDAEKWYWLACHIQIILFGMKSINKNKMKPKIRLVLEQCVENGIRRGYHRAFKYDDKPTEERILEHIEECVMSELYEWFDFEKENQE